MQNAKQVRWLQYCAADVLLFLPTSVGTHPRASLGCVLGPYVGLHKCQVNLVCSTNLQDTVDVSFLLFYVAADIPTHLCAWHCTDYLCDHMCHTYHTISCVHIGRQCMPPFQKRFTAQLASEHTRLSSASVA